MTIEHQNGDPVPIFDFISTRDRETERLSEIDDLLYQIKHEFGQDAAGNLEAFVERCQEISGLNLSEYPSTDIKDRVKVALTMDLSDGEMFVYAEVLCGARRKFPDGYAFNPGANERAIKYLHSVLSSLEITPTEFANRRDKTQFLTKYRLSSFYNQTYHFNIVEFLHGLDSNIREEDIAKAGRASLTQSQIEDIIIAHSKFQSAEETSKQQAAATGN